MGKDVCLEESQEKGLKGERRARHHSPKSKRIAVDGGFLDVQNVGLLGASFSGRSPLEGKAGEKDTVFIKETLGNGRDPIWCQTDAD